MYDIEKMDKRYLVFGNTFLLANRLQTVMDSAAQELTAKQWLVITMLGMFDQPPTLKQLAKLCDTSHQNTKQIALKLEAKGFITILKDETDGRSMRITTTEKYQKFSESFNDYAESFVSKMFDGLTTEELSIMYSTQQKLYKNLQTMKENLR